MKIEQKQDFNPIHIVLETKEEAMLFWQLVEYQKSHRQGQVKQLGIKLSDWFITEAHL